MADVELLEVDEGVESFDDGDAVALPASVSSALKGRRQRTRLYAKDLEVDQRFNALY
jgi:hypothetical protein